MTSEPYPAFPVESLDSAPTSARRSEELQVGIIESPDDFSAMPDEWNELLSSSPSDSLFLTWEWMHTWWKHFGHRRSLYLVTMRSGSRLVALAPLVRTRNWMGPLLELAGSGSICSDYLDVIVRPGFEPAALRTLTEVLAGTGFTVRMSGLREGSAAVDSLTRALVDRGWECNPLATGICPFIDLSGATWDSYLNSLHRKHRSNVNRHLRNLEEEFRVNVDYVVTEEQRRSAMKDLIALHLQRWEKREVPTPFEDPQFLAFHDELSGLALERGWLRLMVLSLDGISAGALYGFRYGRTFFFYQSGFNPELQRHGVGQVIVGLTIRKAIEEGAREYDFLRGGEDYKFSWASQTRSLLTLEFHPPGRLGRIQRNTARSVLSTGRFVKRALRSMQSQLQEEPCSEKQKC